MEGSPTKDGKYTFKLQVTDANKVSATKDFTVIVPKLEFYSTSSFRKGKVGRDYDSKIWISYSSGDPAGNISVKVSGTLPPGLKPRCSGRYVRLVGKPTTPGKYSFILQGTDAKGASIAPKRFTINIAKPDLRIYSYFKRGYKDRYYSSDYVYVTGGTSYTWTKTSGSFPPGLKPTYSGNKAILSGTPSKAGTYRFTLKAIDVKSKVSVSETFTIYVFDFSIWSKLSKLMNKKGTTTSTVAPVDTKSSSSTATSPKPEETVVQTIGQGGITKTSLSVASDDILSIGEGRDEDLVEVVEGEPVTFIIGEWKNAAGTKVEKVSDVKIFINDKLVEGISISDENTFTLPSVRTQEDFRIYVKARSKAGELVSEELYISVIK